MERNALACTQCQRSHLRCDRKFPCAHCRRQQVECVPALAPRQRRRRFPERELLRRVRRYEDLLRENDIGFEPLHPDGHGDQQDNPPSHQTVRASALEADSKVDIHDAVRRRPDTSNQSTDAEYSTDDNGSEPVIQTAWKQIYLDDEDDFLFAGSSSRMNLSNMHPDPVTIMQLWQFYLENVNPLLRVTHVPTVQAQLLGVLQDLGAVAPELEALMFSIYCTAINSLSNDECINRFKTTSKRQLLYGYQFTCRQALLKVRILRSNNRNCLTAFFLYLVSTANTSHPNSLSSTLAIVMHKGKQLGIHSEASLSRLSIFEAEMSRRLWWAVVTLDHRISELVAYETTTLLPLWDCKMPLNLNDSELRVEAQTTPAEHREATESLFTLVRYLQADFLRHASFHLKFVNPRLRCLPKPSRSSDDWDNLLDTTERGILKHCDESNPHHLMTIYTARGFLARMRLLEYYSNNQAQDTQLEASISHALAMLDCDTRLYLAPQIKGYLWFIDLYLPMLAYIHILRFLRSHSESEYTRQAWLSLSANYAALKTRHKSLDGIYTICSRLVLQAWEACRQISNAPEDVPQIVLDMQSKTLQMGPGVSSQSAMEHVDLAAHCGPSYASESNFTEFSYTQQAGYLDMGMSGFEGLESIMFGNLDMNALPRTDPVQGFDFS